MRTLLKRDLKKLKTFLIEIPPVYDIEHMLKDLAEMGYCLLNYKCPVVIQYVYRELKSFQDPKVPFVRSGNFVKVRDEKIIF